MSRYQRFVLGIAAGALTLLGLYGVGSSDYTTVGSILLRSGIVLGVICLAIPQLSGKNASWSLVSLVVIVGLVMVAAARPRYFALAAILAVLFLTLQAIGRRFSRATRSHDK